LYCGEPVAADALARIPQHALERLPRPLPDLGRPHTQVALICGEPLLNPEWPPIAELSCVCSLWHDPDSRGATDFLPRRRVDA
jgi:hypothetical protein